jgi:hypothetical protein
MFTGIITPDYLQGAAKVPTSKGPPSSLVQLRIAVWTGDTRDTLPIGDIRP